MAMSGATPIKTTPIAAQAMKSIPSSPAAECEIRRGDRPTENVRVESPRDARLLAGVVRLPNGISNWRSIIRLPRR